MIVRIVIKAVLLLLFACSVAAQEYTYTVDIDKDTAYLDEAVTITYHVQGQIDAFIPPNLSDWVILSQSTSSSQSWVGDEVTTSMTYRYQIKALQVGDMLISSATLESHGDRHTLPDITIHVLVGRGVYPSAGLSYSHREETKPKMSAQDSLRLRLRMLKTKKI